MTITISVRPRVFPRRHNENFVYVSFDETFRWKGKKERKGKKKKNEKNRGRISGGRFDRGVFLPAEFCRNSVYSRGNMFLPRAELPPGHSFIFFSTKLREAGNGGGERRI